MTNTLGRASPELLSCELWGKDRGLDTPYPLVSHLEDAGCLARELFATWLPPASRRLVAEGFSVPESAASDVARWAALTHDIGKGTCGFQHSSPGACPDWVPAPRGSTFPHAEVSGWSVWSRLDGCEGGVRQLLAEIVSAHHGIASRSPKLGVGKLQEPLMHEVREALFDRFADVERAVRSATSASLGAGILVYATVVVADWLVSQTSVVQERQGGAAIDDLAARIVRDAGLCAPEQRPVSFSGWTGFSPSALQRSVEEAADSWTGPGIMAITAPTGTGKTEAGIAAARGFNRATGRPGVYFAMPTTATADGLAPRLGRMAERGWRGNVAVNVAHSLAALNLPHLSSADADTPRIASQWLRGSRRGLLGHIAVGTVDQLLLGVLKAKHSPLRLAGAATKTIVVDEAHSFDPYTRRLLEHAVHWLGYLQTPVVLLSATLPRGVLKRLISAYQRGTGDPLPSGEMPASGYPGWLAWTPGSGYRSAALKPTESWVLNTRIVLQDSTSLGSRIADDAIAAAQDGACVLVVRNTVADAQQTAAAIRAQHPRTECLHARFPQHERVRKCTDLTARFGPSGGRGPGTVLVATQIVEQSLDIDFDVLLTDLAPFATLLQRAGRIHRHARADRPAGWDRPIAVVYIPAGRDGPNYESPIYMSADQRATHAVLATHTEVAVPDDVQGLVDRATSDAPDLDHAAVVGKAWDRAVGERRGEADANQFLAELTLTGKPGRRRKLADLTDARDLDDRAGTRLGPPSTSVLPVWLDATESRHLDADLATPLVGSRPTGEQQRAIHRHTINVPGYASRRQRWLDALDGVEAWKGTVLERTRLLPLDAEGRYAGSGAVLTLDPFLGLVEADR